MSGPAVDSLDDAVYAFHYAREQHGDPHFEVTITSVDSLKGRAVTVTVMVADLQVTVSRTETFLDAALITALWATAGVIDKVPRPNPGEVWTVGGTTPRRERKGITDLVQVEGHTAPEAARAAATRLVPAFKVLPGTTLSVEVRYHADGSALRWRTVDPGHRPWAEVSDAAMRPQRQQSKEA